MNVILTSIGSKVPLAKLFVEQAQKFDAKVFGTDLDEDIPAKLFLDDVFQVPNITSNLFLERIVSLCKEKKISLVIPTRDQDLLYFSRFQRHFEQASIRVLTPPTNSIELCQDKLSFGRFLAAHGFEPIETFASLDQIKGYPLFARPRWGAGSKGCLKVENESVAKKILGDCNYLLHPFVVAEEYSVDLLTDFNSNPVQAVSRRRIRVENGESKITQIKMKSSLIEAARALAKPLNLIGHSVVQMFDIEGEQPKIIEVNPRFGGASTLSVQAGLQSVHRILAWHFTKTDYVVRKQLPIKNGLKMYRYSEDRFL